MEGPAEAVVDVVVVDVSEPRASAELSRPEPGHDAVELAGALEVSGRDGAANRVYFIEVAAARGGTNRGSTEGAQEDSTRIPRTGLGGGELYTQAELSSAIQQEVERQAAAEEECDIIVHVAETDADGTVRMGQFNVGVGAAAELRHCLGRGLDEWDDKRRCRICLGDEDDGEFITLTCRCRGDMANIHGACADKWFRKKRTGVCELCRVTAYVIVPLPPDPAKKAEAERVANLRFRVVMAGILVAGTLILGAVVGIASRRTTPQIVKFYANYPIGFISMVCIIALLRKKARAGLNRFTPGLLESWVSVAFVTFLLIIVSMSMIMMFGT